MKCLLFIFSVFWSTILVAQQIDYAEYFIDDDPGQGNATSITLSPDDTLDLDIGIAANDLQHGFHQLFIRSRDTSGTWSVLSRQLFYIDTLTVLPENGITTLEWFTNDDPGTDAGYTIAITPGDSIDESIAIPVDTLPLSFNTLFVRTRDSSGMRSVLTKLLFYADPIIQPQNNGIVSAEFFIDADPGLGSGYPINLTAGDTIDASLAIPVDTLTYGFHTVFFRTQDSTGARSVITKQYLMVEPIRVIPDNGLVAVEFYIDTDPGPGNGTPIPMTPGDTVIRDISIPVDTLSYGFHTIFFRAQDSTGLWSILHKELILVRQNAATPSLPEIVKMEYHFPNMEIYQDPNEMFVTGDSTVDNNMALQTDPLESGQHTALIRAMNNEGIWSPLFRTDTFSVLECEIVTNTNDSGLGSFRFALDCTNNLDTVWFDPTVHNQTIFMQIPKIVLDKELYIRADTLSNITIANENANNTVTLLSTTRNLDIEGLNFIGQTPGSLIFSIKAPEGGIVINGVLWENIFIKLE